jgi:hypothetical protein
MEKFDKRLKTEENPSVSNELKEPPFADLDAD